MEEDHNLDRAGGEAARAEEESPCSFVPFL